MFEPPPSDRELTTDLVRHAVEAQANRAAVHRVEHLGSGWEYDVYLIDGHMVVRFPRYAEVAGNLDEAEAVLDFVRAECGSTFSVPRIVLRGEPGPYFPHRFFGHELIPGRSAADIPAPPSPRLAADLGRALTTIHGASTERASRLGVRPQKWNCRSSFEGLVEVLKSVSEVLELVPEAARWVEGVSATHPEYQGTPRFIHDDLQPEHLIIREDSRRLSGIIDWGGALGDPGQDFSFIAAWGGWGFTKTVLDAYQVPMDAGFVPRALFLGRVRALGWLAYEIQMNLDTQRTRRVVRELLSATSSS